MGYMFRIGLILGKQKNCNAHGVDFMDVSHVIDVTTES